VTMNSYMIVFSNDEVMHLDAEHHSMKEDGNLEFYDGQGRVFMTVVKGYWVRLDVMYKEEECTAES